MAVVAKPGFVMLACLIQIWNEEDGACMNIYDNPKNPMMLAEVEEIEINDSYQKLFKTAKVSFPRGTVIRQTVTDQNIEVNANKITVNVEQSGVVATTRVNTSRIGAETFKVGQRIRIRMGYITDPHIAETAKTNATGKTIFNDPVTRARYIAAMHPTANPLKTASAIMFDGHIVKCSIDEPVVLECEDFAGKLKLITCPNVPAGKDFYVQDLFGDDGQYHLLRKAGLKLHPDTDSINVGAISLNDDLTAADVLGEWAKRAKIYSFVRPDENGDPCVYIGRSYFSQQGKDSIYKASDGYIDIDFNYNVADNGLTAMRTDKAFLAVEATSWDTSTLKGKQYHITIRRNPEYDINHSGPKYQVLNETTLSKAAMQAGATVLSKSKDKVDLSSYTIIPYTSKRRKISHEELQLEAIKYFEDYNMNGIEGSLTLFGDFNILSGTKVHLSDKRFSAKNGYYLVDEVTTKFGVNGYRQTIKMPHCISRDADRKKDDE